jgi:hypothetical protein
LKSVVACSQDDWPANVCSDVKGCRPLAKLPVVNVVADIGNGDEPLRCPDVRRCPKYERIDQAEDTGVGTHADGQHQDYQ